MFLSCQIFMHFGMTLSKTAEAYCVTIPESTQPYCYYFLGINYADSMQSSYSPHWFTLEAYSHASSPTYIECIHVRTDVPTDIH